MQPLLTQKESDFLTKLLKSLINKKKLSANEQLILNIHSSEVKFENDIKKLKLLLKSEKMKQQSLDSQKKLKEIDKQEMSKQQQSDQQAELLFAQRFFLSIKEGEMLGDDYSYAKLLRKFFKDGIFTIEEQQVLLKYLKNNNIDFEESVSGESNTLSQDITSATVITNPHTTMDS